MRLFTAPQLALLSSDRIRVNLLATFFLDEGTYRFCDDIVDLSDGTNTYIGASALVSEIEYTSGIGLAAEPVTLQCDGQRMAQAGIADPASVLRDILTYIHRQRRVDMALAFRSIESEVSNIVLPLAACKINSAVLIDEKIDPLGNAETVSRLKITLDSLASRYNRATFRTRSNEDQHEIDASDNFFNLTESAVKNEPKLFWGKNAPFGSSPRYGGSNPSGPFGDGFGRGINIP